MVRRLVPSEERDDVPAIAAPLMPALGVAFAILVALTLSSEAGYLRAAKDLVSNEAGEASRLAWAATGPGVGTAPIDDFGSLAGDLAFEAIRSSASPPP